MKSHKNHEKWRFGQFLLRRAISIQCAKDSLCLKLSFGPSFMEIRSQELRNEGKRGYHTRSLSPRPISKYPPPSCRVGCDVGRLLIMFVLVVFFTTKWNGHHTRSFSSTPISKHPPSTFPIVQVVNFGCVFIVFVGCAGLWRLFVVVLNCVYWSFSGEFAVVFGFVSLVFCAVYIFVVFGCVFSCVLCNFENISISILILIQGANDS